MVVHEIGECRVLGEASQCLEGGAAYDVPPGQVGASAQPPLLGHQDVDQGVAVRREAECRVQAGVVAQEVRHPEQRVPDELVAGVEDGHVRLVRGREQRVAHHAPVGAGLPVEHVHRQPHRIAGRRIAGVLGGAVARERRAEQSRPVVTSPWRRTSRPVQERRMDRHDPTAVVDRGQQSGHRLLAVGQPTIRPRSTTSRGCVGAAASLSCRQTSINPRAAAAIPRWRRHRSYAAAARPVRRGSSATRSAAARPTRSGSAMTRCSPGLSGPRSSDVSVTTAQPLWTASRIRTHSSEAFSTTMQVEEDLAPGQEPPLVRTDEEVRATLGHRLVRRHQQLGVEPGQRPCCAGAAAEAPRLRGAEEDDVHVAVDLPAAPEVPPGTWPRGNSLLSSRRLVSSSTESCEISNRAPSLRPTLDRRLELRRARVLHPERDGAGPQLLGLRWRHGVVLVRHDDRHGRWHRRRRSRGRDGSPPRPRAPPATARHRRPPRGSPP